MGLFLPLLEGGDAPSVIVKTLSLKPGLTAKQVYNQTKTQNNFSYQAIHKALQKLQNEGVVEKTGREYFLSSGWLNSLEQFVKSCKQSNGSVLLENTSWPQNLQFSTLMELSQFLLESLLELTRRFPEPVGVGHWRRAWPGIIFTKEDYLKLNEIMKRKRYLLINGNSFADKFFASYYEKMENKNVPNAEDRTLYGIQCATECDLVVEADYIFYIYFNTELKKKIDEIYNKIDEQKQDAGMLEIYSLVHDYKTSINVVVNKNAEIAEQLRKETLERFNNLKGD